LKKVISIAPYTYLPYSSGGQKLIALFNEYIGALCSLTVISTPSNNTTLVKNYRMRTLLRKGFIRYADISLYKKIKHLIQEQQAEHLIIEHPYMGWLGWLLKKSTGIHLTIHTHNIESERFRSLNKKWWPLLRWYEAWVLQQADTVFCISEEDKEYMITSFGLSGKKCFIVPFGISEKNIPNDKEASKKKICELHQIPNDETILLFNGALNYEPNLNAVKAILNEINPLLLQQKEFKYKIIICGRGLPETMNGLQEYSGKNVIYTGFVDDIEPYFKGADIFLNTVITGGGVKTKLMEAIAYNTTVVSTESGALGCDRNVCGNKLRIVPDNDWHLFTKKILENLTIQSNTPQAFYDKYYWGNIAKNVIEILSDYSAG
jgi:glycosyltransferase involved in cell wall biosynthesis